MTRLILLISLLMIPLMSQALEMPASDVDFLESKLPESVVTEHKDNTSLLKHCPDSTCEVFKVKEGSIGSEKAELLFVLYLLEFDGGFSVTNLLKDAETSKVATAAIDKLDDPECATDKGPKRLKCVLLLHEKKGDIKIQVSRFEEGEPTTAKFSDIKAIADLKSN